VGGGAWPFLVGGAICLVDSDNERDSSLLNRRSITGRHFSRLVLLVFRGEEAFCGVSASSNEVLIQLLRGTGGV
jgi:hypothetical protein